MVPVHLAELLWKAVPSKFRQSYSLDRSWIPFSSYDDIVLHVYLLHLRLIDGFYKSISFELGTVYLPKVRVLLGNTHWPLVSVVWASNAVLNAWWLSFEVMVSVLGSDVQFIQTQFGSDSHLTGFDVSLLSHTFVRQARLLQRGAIHVGPIHFPFLHKARVEGKQIVGELSVVHHWNFVKINVYLGVSSVWGCQLTYLA